MAGYIKCDGCGREAKVGTPHGIIRSGFTAVDGERLTAELCNICRQLIRDVFNSPLVIDVPDFVSRDDPPKGAVEGVEREAKTT
jgi:uncharacterized Zn finger protein